MSSLARTAQAATAESSRIRALATMLMEWIGPLFTPARHSDVSGRSHSVQLRRENASLRALLAKTQKELTGAQQREKHTRYLAFHDDLTALPNRRFFLERLGLALDTQDSGPPNVAVIYLDLDGFKAINDTYGHATGDALLSLIATRLAHALRAQDLVSRIGGDEFACLITGVSCRDRLQQIAMALFEAVAAPFKLGELALNVRPSIGVAMCPLDGTTVQALVQAADAAMYGAKQNRSSLAFFQPAFGAAEPEAVQ